METNKIITTKIKCMRATETTKFGMETKTKWRRNSKLQYKKIFAKLSTNRIETHKNGLGSTTK